MQPCDMRRVAVSVRNRPSSLRITVCPADGECPDIVLTLVKDTGLATGYVTTHSNSKVGSDVIDLDFSPLHDNELVGAAVDWVAAIYKTHAGLD